MQKLKWNRKKAPISPLLVLLLMVFIAFLILHSETTIQQIHENQDHIHNHIHQDEASSTTYVKPNLSGHLNRAKGMFDSSVLPTSL